MIINQLYRRQKLSISIDEAWSFFSSPFYLNQITPEFFQVKVTSKVPEQIYGGLLISYRMTAVFGIPMAWLSEISHCDQPKRFVYQQRIGPFRFWSHEVCFTEFDGGVTVEDIVFYVMPLRWLGNLLNRLLIRSRLEKIFNTRRDWLQNRWGLHDDTRE
jgi:ligand-binding SRPBCC domain-containing protein